MTVLLAGERFADLRERVLADASAGTVEALLKDTARLTAILTYHVIPSRVVAADLAHVVAARTVQGQNVQFSLSPSARVSGANIVATDIAARGIDVAGIHRVINFDLPQTVEDYVHRVGRTARAEASGHATSFAAPEEHSFTVGMEKIPTPGASFVSTSFDCVMLT